MLGDHNVCDEEFYCDLEHRDELKCIKISQEARNALDRYLRDYSARCDKIEGVTSNIVECFFSVNNKFQ